MLWIKGPSKKKGGNIWYLKCQISGVFFGAPIFWNCELGCRVVSTTEDWSNVATSKHAASRKHGSLQRGAIRTWRIPGSFFFLGGGNYMKLQ